MASAKIQFRNDKVEFSCEGEEVWVASQLDKILNTLSPQHTVNSQQGSQIGHVKIDISNLDISSQPCDVLILKHAQSFFGADLAVSSLLTDFNGINSKEMQVKPGEFRLFPSNKALEAHQVLFVGVDPLGKFEYKQIRDFSTRALQIVKREIPKAVHIAMTIHGVGYGLDERKSLRAQLMGLRIAIDDELILSELQQISIVEKEQAKAVRLEQILNELL